MRTTCDDEDRMTRKRADVVLVERGFFTSRARAQEAIAAGLVTVNGAVIRKASDTVPEEAVITAEQPHPYVSRGGVKLAAALDIFQIDPKGLVSLDIGASTGGFTEVLLKRDAAHVYAVDVGHGQIHPTIAADPRVTNLEGTDARSLSTDLIPQPIDLLVSDVSFISLKLVLPPTFALARTPAHLLALIKPQFEVGRRPGKKGIVRDPLVHAAVCDEIAAFVSSHGWRVAEIVPSPITGGDGNREFFIAADRT
jgi:23S rRNA (cytidine1920-2'-O)/16S rRNA (cytidine1409-2'-O)-methyltransferase